jgi:hypothetical protein
MSAAPAAVAHRPAGAPRPAVSGRPVLSLVAAPRRRLARAVFVVACTAVLVGALVAVLVLNTAMATAAFEKHDLNAELAQLAESRAHTTELLTKRAAPAALAKEARELGMVPAGSLAFIRLADGKVIGDPQPAKDPAQADDGGETR